MGMQCFYCEMPYGLHDDESTHQCRELRCKKCKQTFVYRETFVYHRGRCKKEVD